MVRWDDHDISKTFDYSTKEHLEVLFLSRLRRTLSLNLLQRPSFPTTQKNQADKPNHGGGIWNIFGETFRGNSFRGRNTSLSVRLSVFFYVCPSVRLSILLFAAVEDVCMYVRTQNPLCMKVLNSRARIVTKYLPSYRRKILHAAK